jgi:protein XagA
MRFSIKCLCAIAAAGMFSEANAGAWTQPAGRAQLITTGLYYTADKLYTDQGQKQNQPRYTKYELNPYMEYGLWDGMTLGSNLSLQRTQQEGTPEQVNWGVGESEFFLRQRLWQENGLVVSAEPMVKLPSPDSSSDLPRLGGSRLDIGMGFSAGYGFAALGLHHFVNLDTQFRYRLGTPKDQVRLAATAGIAVAPDWTVLPQLFLTYRTSNPGMASFTQSSGDDYNLAKLQLSAVHSITPDISLQMGGFRDIDGKNSGAGYGLLVAVWKSF